MTPWTVDCHSPLSKGFSRQEYQSGLLFPSPKGLTDPGVEPRSPALQAYSLLSRLQKSILFNVKLLWKKNKTVHLIEWTNKSKCLKEHTMYHYWSILLVYVRLIYKAASIPIIVNVLVYEKNLRCWSINIRKILFLKSVEKRLFSCLPVFFWKQTSMLSPGFPCSLDFSITSVCLVPVTTNPWSPGDAGLCEAMFIVLFARLHQRQKNETPASFLR